MYEILNKQVKFTQYIGTCKSAYTKGYALNRVPIQNPYRIVYIGLVVVDFIICDTAYKGKTLT